MGCGYDDTILVGSDLAPGMRIEGSCAAVHRRGEHIASEAEYQLANLFIGLRADVAQFLLEIVCGPRLQAPVLVVDEDAPVAD